MRLWALSTLLSKDVDLRLTARGGIRRQMTDPLGAELEERIVDLAGIRQVYPAELSWQLQLWSADEVEIHNLMANLRQETDNPASGQSRSSCHDDSHLENSRPSPCSSCLARRSATRFPDQDLDDHRCALRG